MPMPTLRSSRVRKRKRNIDSEEECGCDSDHRRGRGRPRSRGVSKRPSSKRVAVAGRPRSKRVSRCRALNTKSRSVTKSPKCPRKSVSGMKSGEGALWYLKKSFFPKRNVVYLKKTGARKIYSMAVLRFHEWIKEEPDFTSKHMDFFIRFQNKTWDNVTAPEWEHLQKIVEEYQAYMENNGGSTAKEKKSGSYDIVDEEEGDTVVLLIDENAIVQLQIDEGGNMTLFLEVDPPPQWDENETNENTHEMFDASELDVEVEVEVACVETPETDRVPGEPPFFLWPCHQIDDSECAHYLDYTIDTPYLDSGPIACFTEAQTGECSSDSDTSDITVSTNAESDSESTSDIGSPPSAPEGTSKGTWMRYFNRKWPIAILGPNTIRAGKCLINNINYRNYVKDVDVVMSYDDDYNGLSKEPEDARDWVKCGKAYCRLGCVCASLKGTVVRDVHCQHKQCVFSSVCWDVVVAADTSSIAERAVKRRQSRKPVDKFQSESPNPKTSSSSSSSSRVIQFHSNSLHSSSS